MRFSEQAPGRAHPCERDHKIGTRVCGLIAAMSFALALVLGAPAALHAQAPHAAPEAATQSAHQPEPSASEQPHPTQEPGAHPAEPPAGEHAAEAQHGAGGEHGAAAEHAPESPWGLVARIFNFAILAGVLVYVLRTPMGTYIKDRSEQVRRDLVEAADLRVSASAQIDEISARLAALPGEIELLKSRGAQEIGAEEERIRRAADAERLRLLDQTRREIDLQLRVAKRDLKAYAADLAVSVARTRIQKNITPDDQLRLVDRYLEQVEGKR